MRTRALDTVRGPVGALTLSRAQFITALENMKDPDDGDTVTASGTLSLSKRHTCLLGESGTFTLALPPGESFCQEKSLIFTGTAGSTAIFRVTGTFVTWSRLAFTKDARYARVLWQGSAWVLLCGDVAVEE